MPDSPAPTAPPSRPWLNRRWLLVGCLAALGLVPAGCALLWLMTWLNERPLDSTAGQVAFLSSRDGRPQLYLMNADGSAQTRLADTPGSAWYPAWSPDGRYLAFAAGTGNDYHQDLYRVDAGGDHLTRLTDWPDSEYSPTWSPDGQRLAFVSQSPNNTDMGDHIYTIKPDGSDRQLVLLWACDDLHWSPEGTRLLFYSNRGQGGTNGEIYATNLDGTGRTALSRHPAADNHPRWRPE